MQRFFLIFLLTVALAVSAGLAAHPSDATTKYACGVERWTVKTLQDRPHLIANRLTTVKYLATRRPPSYIPSTRLPFERHIFTVIARVTFVREEADSDYHLILSERGYHMIAEAPASYCDRRAKLRYRLEMATARLRARSCARARVTGVAFFDFGTLA